MSRARFEVRLTGADANLGDVDAADVAHLILGLQKAIQRTATQLLGRSHGKGGQPSSAAKQAASLRLLGIRDGSVVLVLEAPDPAVIEGELDLEDVSLAELTQRRTFDVITGEETDFPGTALALEDMAKKLDIGGRNESVSIYGSDVIEEPAILDASTRGRLVEIATRRNNTEGEAHVVGTLYEADFEKHSAQLRTQLGRSVKVRFDEDRALEVKEALRELSSVEGQATYRCDSPEIARLDLKTIYSQGHFPIDPGDFWTEPTLEELAHSQGITGPQSIEDLTIPDLTAEESEALGKALGL